MNSDHVCYIVSKNDGNVNWQYYMRTASNARARMHQTTRVHKHISDAISFNTSEHVPPVYRFRFTIGGDLVVGLLCEDGVSLHLRLHDRKCAKLPPNSYK